MVGPTCKALTLKDLMPYEPKESLHIAYSHALPMEEAVEQIEQVVCATS